VDSDHSVVVNQIEVDLPEAADPNEGDPGGSQNPGPEQLPGEYTQGECTRCLLRYIVPKRYMAPIDGCKEDRPLQVGSNNEIVVRNNLPHFFCRNSNFKIEGNGKEYGLVCMRENKLIGVSADWVSRWFVYPHLPC